MGNQPMDDERTHVLPDPSAEFGRRVRDRLRDEVVVWLSTVTAAGTPQPNPVWFLWQPDSGDPWGDGSFLVYTLKNAARLDTLTARPHVSLHFNSTPDGGDIMVFTGRVEVLPGYPAAHEVPDYVQKYTRPSAGSPAARRRSRSSWRTIRSPRGSGRCGCGGSDFFGRVGGRG